MDALDTQAATRERFGGGPFSTSAIGQEALRLWIRPLAAYLAERKPPRGLEMVIRGLSREQLALLALRAVLDQINVGWDRRKKRKKPVKNPDMLFRLELGRTVRAELEFAGLLAAKKWVRASRNKHAALGKFRRIDWSDRECAQCGDWLWDCLAEMACFDSDERGYPKVADEHKAALDELAEELVFRHPLYKPSLLEPAPWTSWRVEYPGDDRISSTFVKATDPKTVETIKAAFADGSITEHAQGVSAVQRVPLKINPVTLPLLKEFGGGEYKRDAIVAEELLDKEQFWCPIRCDFRGRLVHVCDFNYTRSDPVRALFMFAKGKPIGGSIGGLEIAVANAYGIKGTWPGRLRWVADNRELIKACAADPSLIWLRDYDDRCKPKAKEPFLFAAACAEYIAASRCGPDYVTHLPIWLDASSNGLQHLALMRRDPELAAMVNLNTRGDKGGPPSALIHARPDGKQGLVRFAMDVELAGLPLGPEAREWLREEHADAELQDVYERIAKRVRLDLYADRHNPLSQFWLEPSRNKHLRDFCKQPVMTLMYGVTEWGMVDQITEAAEKLSLDVPNKAALHLRDHIWSAIGQILPIAVGTREDIQKLARHRLERGAFMEWVTQSGFPVANRYRKSKLERVSLPFLGQKVTIAEGYTEEFRESKTINSAVANFTHSHDATHLVRSVNATVARGITNILTIHDCYATLAPDTSQFAQVRRSELARMYYDNPLEALWKRNVRAGANELPLPAMGNLYVPAVAFSEYSDR